MHRISTTDFTKGPIESEADEHAARSEFVRTVVQRANAVEPPPASLSTTVPKSLVQFWDDLRSLPDDVNQCLESWLLLKSRGFTIRVFDATGAQEFIASKLGSRYEYAFQRCYHPAMQADYFRLCCILLDGGCYVDADDVYSGLSIEQHFSDGRLKLQPLCYDVSTDQMVPPNVFTTQGAISNNWIYYFNNTPVLAGPGHPIIERALENATRALERERSGELPDIQSTTGPGNLTRTIFELARKNSEMLSTLCILPDWDRIAISQWPLSYRSDARNWRLSDRREYRPNIREDK